MASDTNRLDDPGRPAPNPDAWRPEATRRRADAERNIAAILDAGLACFSRNPDASLAEVAQAAGVGRITLYGHFPSRQELMDAVFAHALAKANAVLDAEAIDHGAASEALSRLIRSSRPILAQHRGLLAAAQRELPRPGLLATFYRQLHPAAEEVDTGRLDPAQAGDALATTILAALAA